ncbi:hypothetical protein [Neorhizobium galegae]|uniref:hypothetical protein n=1 Tax=Neorhizobium galegae TaxID=399 RepID=UPI002106DFC5|nr:hypothetical protein [Neorhizobium galegae]MCQ1855879.1 hypothetical protein [Neorhizobium galegae]
MQKIEAAKTARIKPNAPSRGVLISWHHRKNGIRQTKALLTVLVAFNAAMFTLDEARADANIINGAYPNDSYSHPVYRNILDGRLEGKMAKVVTAGRILNDTQCDSRRFDFSAVNDLAARAANSVDMKEWLTRGKGDSLSLKGESGWCDLLYFDAANWGMAIPMTANKKILREAKMTAAVETNNCNWDETARGEVIKYPAINDEAKKRAGDRSIEIHVIYTANSEAVQAATDAGETFGTVDEANQLKKNCMEISAFIKNELR